MNWATKSLINQATTKILGRWLLLSVTINYELIPYIDLEAEKV